MGDLRRALEESFGKDFVEFLEEWCEWGGWSVEEYIREALKSSIASDLDYVADVRNIPSIRTKVEEFRTKLEQL